MTRFTIILDLDGTLADTAPDLVAVANDLLARMGAGPVDPDKGRIAAGQGARRILEAALTDQGLALPREDAWPDIIARFIGSYRQRIARHTRLFDGMEELLAKSRENGFALGVCTNKKQHLAEALLQALGVRDHFGSVTGADTTGQSKPDPAPLLHCISQCGGQPEQVLIAGDSMSDVLAARAIGAPCALAAWGYLDRPASLYQADYTVHSPEDILALACELRNA